MKDLVKCFVPYARAYRIKRQREAMGMMHYHLAQAIKVSTSQIQDYETGEAVPTPHVLDELMRVLGVDFRILPDSMRLQLDSGSTSTCKAIVLEQDASRVCESQVEA